jgi:hypothetical protein
MIDGADAMNKADLICWTDGGKAFKIGDKVRFEKELLQQFFPGVAKIESFYRSLNRWGIRKIRTGKSKGNWIHRQDKFFKGCNAVAVRSDVAEAKLNGSNEGGGNANVGGGGGGHENRPSVASQPNPKKLKSDNQDHPSLSSSLGQSSAVSLNQLPADLLNQLTNAVSSSNHLQQHQSQQHENLGNLGSTLGNNQLGLMQLLNNEANANALNTNALLQQHLSSFNQLPSGLGALSPSFNQPNSMDLLNALSQNNVSNNNNLFGGNHNQVNQLMQLLKNETAANNNNINTNNALLQQQHELQLNQELINALTSHNSNLQSNTMQQLLGNHQSNLPSNLFSNQFSQAMQIPSVSDVNANLLQQNLNRLSAGMTTSPNTSLNDAKNMNSNNALQQLNLQQSLMNGCLGNTANSSTTNNNNNNAETGGSTPASMMHQLPNAPTADLAELLSSSLAGHDSNNNSKSLFEQV